MTKELKFNLEARELIKEGIDVVARAVKVTIGPKGRNVVLDKGYGSPTITNDGVSIAKEITLSNKFQNMGAEIIKEVASKTNEIAGDGTTTAVILTQAIVNEGLKQTTMGANAMGIRLGIEKASNEAVNALKSLAKPIDVKNKDEVRQVASISSESIELGAIIAETIEKVGKDGVVTVEESQSFGVEQEIVEGMEFDKGFISPYMITNSERMESEYKDSFILLTDKKISSIKDILPLLESVSETGKKELVIIADDVDGEALTTLVVNKLRGTFSVLAVKAPGYGDKKKEILEDIATTIGATVVSEERGIKFESTTMEMLGKAGRVISTKDSTKIVGGKGKKANIEKRIIQLRGQRTKTDSKFDKEKLDERISKLAGGVAVIKVGATTETEMKYLKLKIEDAVNATRAAIEEGVVPGGGVALVRAIKKMSMKETAKGFEKEFKVGFDIVVKAMEAPLRQIAINAGKDDGSVIVEKVKESKGNAGYDALEDEMVPDMFASGIIDPVKVTRIGLERASSAAAMLLTTEVAIVDEPEKDQGAGAGDGHMHGMGY